MSNCCFCVCCSVNHREENNIPFFEKSDSCIRSHSRIAISTYSQLCYLPPPPLPVLFQRSVTGRFSKVISTIRATFPPVLDGITVHFYQLAVNSDGHTCFAYKTRTSSWHQVSNVMATALQLIPWIASELRTGYCAAGCMPPPQQVLDCPQDSGVTHIDREMSCFNLYCIFVCSDCNLCYLCVAICFLSLTIGFVSVFSPTRERATLQRCTPWCSAQISRGRPVRSKHRTVSLCTRKSDDTDVRNRRTAFLPNSCVHRTASCADSSYRISQNSNTKFVKIQPQIHWQPSIRCDFHCAHCD